MTITKHAEDRMKERNGLPKKAVRRLAEKAYYLGLTRSETRGAVRKWMDTRYEAHKTADGMRLYGDKLYLFTNDVLVTVIQVPAELMPKLVVQSKKKSEEIAG